MFSTQEAPTLYPTKDEFSNPIQYLNSKEIVKLGTQYGILKIKPPKNWIPPLSINPETFKFHTRLQTLSELNLTNRSREFWLSGLNNYFRMKGIKPLKTGYVNLNTGKRVHLYDIYVNNAYEMYKSMFINKDLYKNLMRYVRYLEKHINDQNHQDSTHQANPINEAIDNFKQQTASSSSCEVCGGKEEPTKILICDDCERNFHMKCLDPPLTKVPKEDWFCDECLIGSNGDYGFEEDFNSIFSVDQFQQHCEEFKNEYCDLHLNGHRNPSVNLIEKEFWKLVENENENEFEVRYGADIHNEAPDEISGFPTVNNSLIDKEKYKEYIEHPFNLCNLPFSSGSLLNYVRTESREQISGMTVPWIYIGSMFSTFCWHKEDHYTMSANYCHVGSTKKWYGIPASECVLFEKIFHDVSPDYFTKQPDLLHQLVSLLSPDKLVNLAKLKYGKKLRIYSVDQEPNEFVITFPKVYHAGFNCGFNINEAVNFTMPFWLNYGQESIDEYKLVKKENVFNYYKLLRNIMDDILLKHEENGFSEDTIKQMIRVSFTDYCLQIREYSTALANVNLTNFINTIDKKVDYDELVKELIKRNLEKRILRETGNRRMSRMRKASEEAEEVDEFICHDCKSFVNFKWVEIDVLKELEKEHQDEFKLRSTIKKEEATDMTTSELASVSIVSNDSVNSVQLPTPNQSPREFQREWGNSNRRETTDDSIVEIKQEGEEVEIKQEDEEVEIKHEDEEILNNTKRPYSHAKTAATTEEHVRKSRRIAARKEEIQFVKEKTGDDDSIIVLDQNSFSLKETKTRMLTRMKRKRMKNGSYGKIVLCLSCLGKKLDGLVQEPPEELQKLHDSCTLYHEVELKDLQNYICVDIQPKVLELLANGGGL